ncbi:MAG: nucleotide pyrophosphohydrolase [Promethearchaeota archaeon]|nr:MAG: nucleotide pyrophosphohydrolase [Candidatus Lokiarchaeota archaeon]
MDTNRNENNTTISFLRNEVKKFVQERDWTQYHTPKNLIQALQIEAAELSELFLFKELDINDILMNKEFIDKISNEMADVLVYLISLCNSLDIDIVQAFEKKMEINRNKYPIREFNNGVYYKK